MSQESTVREEDAADTVPDTLEDRECREESTDVMFDMDCTPEEDGYGHGV